MPEQPLRSAQIDAEFTKALHHNLHVIKFDNDNVDIKVGTIVGADDGLDIINFLIDKRIDMTSNGLNALDTGAEAANTWYYIWAIKNPTTGVYGGLASLSDTAPTLPAGFTLKRLISSVWNDNSSNIYSMEQVGTRYHYTAVRPTTSAVIPTVGITFIDLDPIINADGNPETAMSDFVPANARTIYITCSAHHTDGFVATSHLAPYAGWVGLTTGGRVCATVDGGIANDRVYLETQQLVDENQKLVIRDTNNATGDFRIHMNGFDVIL